ncbi:uncharacterized protein EI90DRAFT_3037795 [Cantharellus anzutake]|uniref:uncharacterized protein n=1 Tax=Cantharellus anzutake TaxID=1750568 RepID=UPI0019059B01|nr:uncharacterized protein EI90DRAFT_3037795 [Cantharellus anzutake]KAF8339797.1 hypothetical protein EI90DRAFT_3037795 [Cantharellus anzutake]
MPESPTFTYHEVPLEDFIAATSDAPNGSETLETIAEEIRMSRAFDQALQQFVSALALEELATIKVSSASIFDMIFERCQELGSGGPSMGLSVESSPIVFQIQHHATILSNYFTDSEPTIAYQDDMETYQDHWFTEEFQEPTRPDRIPSSLPKWGDYIRAKATDAMARRGNRRHVIGVLVNHSNVTFWYFDRSGGFYSAPVDLVKRPCEVISGLVRLSLSTAFALGLEPAIEFPDPWRAFDTMESAAIVIQGIPFLLQVAVHISRDLEGRGLVLFSARKQDTSEHSTSLIIPENVMIKFSWEHVGLPRSDSLYRRAEQCGVHGVAQLFCSSTLGHLSEGPRTRLKHESRIDYRNRELRAQVLGPSCVPLYRVLPDRDFERAFRSLVEVHHRLYKNAGILHCNINMSSLMASKDSPPRGVLLDLDFAIQVQDGDRDLSPEPTFSGTLPFLSMDLLSAATPPPNRLYRHDLESFFYALGWILGRYDARGNPRMLHQFAAWHKGPLNDIISAKWRFMGVPSHIPSTRSSPSLQIWLRRLCRLFNGGYGGENQDADYDQETLGGGITFDTFMGAAPQIGP